MPQTRRADREPRSAGGHGEWPGPRGQGPGWHRADELGRRLFRLAPEERGPLQPGEEEELLDFAREHAPRLYRALERLRQRNPERFREKLTEYAPRLRHLRRIYAESPRLAGIIKTHAENMFRIKRGMRALRQHTPDSARHERALESIRALVADNVRLEIEALDELAIVLEKRRAERIENLVTYLIGDEVDPATLPEDLGRLITEFRAATGQERDRLRESIGGIAARRVAAEIEALQERRAQMEENAPEEVDRRMQRLLEARAKHRPEQPGRRPRHGRGP